MISLIAAMSKNRVIGRDNQLPWHMPVDLEHFKRLTLNKPIIMGRVTFECLGEPLPKRRNIVVSHQTGLTIPGCETFTSLEKALDAVKDEPEIMIIGGATIYEQSLRFADRIYITIIDTVLEGDTFFPEWPNTWHVVDERHHKKDAEHAFDCAFLTLERD